MHLVCFFTAVYFVQYVQSSLATVQYSRPSSSVTRFFALRGYTTLLCTIILPFVLSSSHLVNNIRILRTEAELTAHFVPLEASQVVAESSPAAIAQIYFLAFNVSLVSSCAKDLVRVKYVLATSQTIFTSSIVLWRASTSKAGALSACLAATLLSFTAGTST